MFAELLKISEEELARIMAEWVYGDRDAPIKTFDVIAVCIMTWKQVIRLNARMNNYDAKGQGDMLTVNEVIRLTGLSRSTINRLMREYALNSVKVGGRRYIFRQSVESYMDVSRQYRVNPWCPRAKLRLPWLKRDKLRKAVMDVPPMFEEQRQPPTTAEPNPESQPVANSPTT